MDQQAADGQALRPAPPQQQSWGGALGWEVLLASAHLFVFLLSLALCSGVLHVTATKFQENYSHHLLAISFTWLNGNIAVGRIR